MGSPKMLVLLGMTGAAQGLQVELVILTTPAAGYNVMCLGGTFTTLGALMTS
jgi:hypothetical protein